VFLSHNINPGFEHVHAIYFGFKGSMQPNYFTISMMMYWGDENESVEKLKKIVEAESMLLGVHLFRTQHFADSTKTSDGFIPSVEFIRSKDNAKPQILDLNS